MCVFMGLTCRVTNKCPQRGFKEFPLCVSFFYAIAFLFMDRYQCTDFGLTYLNVPSAGGLLFSIGGTGSTSLRAIDCDDDDPKAPLF